MKTIEKNLKNTIKFLRGELKSIVDNYDPHTDIEGNDIQQDTECFCSRCIAVRALKFNYGRQNKISS